MKRHLSMGVVLVGLLFSSCAHRKMTSTYQASDFSQIERAHNDTDKNVRGVQRSIHRTRSLAEEADYKLMRASQMR